MDYSLLLGGIILILLFLLIFTTIFFNRRKNLNAIKAKTVGDNQHGSSRMMTLEELKKLPDHEIVTIPKKLTNMEGKWKPGRLLYYDSKTGEAVIDTSDTHADVRAPTKTGKTTEHVVPNVQYNAMAGASMIVPDMKDELYKLLAPSLKEELDYLVIKIDFIRVLDSFGWEIMKNVNYNMDKYLTTGDLFAKATAESAAINLATTIQNQSQTTENRNQYYSDASRNLITVVILLVSQFGEKEERHLSSVRSLIQDISTIPKTPGVSKLQILFERLPKDFSALKQAGAAYGAGDPETESNIFSSALNDLSPFNDAIAEQITSVYKDEMFDFEDLTKNKTCVFLILPEHKKTFYVFMSLLYKELYFFLMEYCMNKPGGTRLDRVIKFIGDEFAIFPRIEDLSDAISTSRDKGYLMDLIYQDFYQIEEKYGEKKGRNILHQCGTSIVLGLAKNDLKEAERLSKIIGNKTIMTGSTTAGTTTSNGKTSRSSSITESMMTRPLMTPDEILTLPEDTALLFKTNEYVMKTNLPKYYSKEWGIPLIPYIEEQRSEIDFKPVKYISFDKVLEELNKLRIVANKSHSEKEIMNADYETMFFDSQIEYRDFSAEDDQAKAIFYRISEEANDERIKQYFDSKQFTIVQAFVADLYDSTIDKKMLDKAMEYLKKNQLST